MKRRARRRSRDSSEELKTGFAEFRTLRPENGSPKAAAFIRRLGWVCYVVFVEDLLPERDIWEFLIPRTRERCWVVSIEERGELVPYLASGTLSELKPEGFADWFKRWAEEAVSIPQGHNVH